MACNRSNCAELSGRVCAASGKRRGKKSRSKKNGKHKKSSNGPISVSSIEKELTMKPKTECEKLKSLIEDAFSGKLDGVEVLSDSFEGHGYEYFDFEELKFGLNGNYSLKEIKQFERESQEDRWTDSLNDQLLREPDLSEDEIASMREYWIKNDNSSIDNLGYDTSDKEEIFKTLLDAGGKNSGRGTVHFENYFVSFDYDQTYMTNRIKVISK